MFDKSFVNCRETSRRGMFVCKNGVAPIVLSFSSWTQRVYKTTNVGFIVGSGRGFCGVMVQGKHLASGAAGLIAEDEAAFGAWDF
jgi:hypothetical protein